MRNNKHERKATTKQLNDIWQYVVAIFLIIVFFFGYGVLFLSNDEKHGDGSAKGEPSDTTLVEELRDTFINRKKMLNKRVQLFLKIMQVGNITIIYEWKMVKLIGLSAMKSE